MIFVLLYQCFAGFLAWWDYTLIKKGWTINHFANGLIHLIVAFLIGYYTKWAFSLSTLLFTRVVFDTCLNIFRRKGVGYVSPVPASKIDQVEKRIILWIAAKVPVLGTDESIKWTAIGLRIFILIIATIILLYETL